MIKLVLTVVVIVLIWLFTRILLKNRIRLTNKKRLRARLLQSLEVNQHQHKKR